MLEHEPIEPHRIRPISRVDLDRMVDAGIVGEDERIELIRGVLVAMSPPNPPHAGTTGWLSQALTLALGRRASVHAQSPFAAAHDSQPQPDIAVLPFRRYDAEHPREAYLLIEVSDSSKRLDLGVKAGIYAEAGVPEYWVVNLPDEVIEVFTEPSPDGYRARRRAVRGDRLTLAAFPDVELAVDEILPPSG